MKKSVLKIPFINNRLYRLFIALITIFIMILVRARERDIQWKTAFLGQVSFSF